MVDITLEHLSNPKGVGIIVIHDNMMLLGKRKDSGSWSLAGGGIEKGEQPRQTAARELFEEFNLAVHEDELKYYGVTPSPANPFKPKDSTVGCSIEYYIEYSGYVGKPHVIIEPTEFLDYKWVTFDEALNEFDMYPNSKSSIELFLRKEAK